MTAEEALGERLQKVLARAGFGSRRICDDLINAGRVTVNGEVALLGKRVDVRRDRIVVDGAEVGVLPGLVYYLLNKPRGVITTARDPSGRPTVLELVPDNPRIFPVGRLDADSEGLLVMTNDGRLAQALTHPSHGVEKEYLVELDADPSPGTIRSLREGVELGDGTKSAPASVARVAPCTLRIVIHEGKNRQIRRMCGAVGHEVTRLVRTRIGPLQDQRLAPGSHRALTTSEVRGLEAASVLRSAPKRTGRLRRR